MSWLERGLGHKEGPACEDQMGQAAEGQAYPLGVQLVHGSIWNSREWAQEPCSASTGLFPGAAHLVSWFLQGRLKGWGGNCQLLAALGWWPHGS